MVQLQIISRVLQSQDYGIIDNNQLTEDYFAGYEEEFDFIKNHYAKYKNVPDKATFLSNFPDIELVEVTESEQYLIDTIREEFLYTKVVPVIQKSAELLKTNSNDAVEYMLNSVKKLRPDYDLGGVNIIKQSQERLESFRDRRDNQDNWFFTTGFEELDEIIHGLQRGEEFLVLVARVNQGKSWVLEKICTHIWEIGFNVGYVSPEMGALNVGYRFDSLHKHFSNKDMVFGNKEFDDAKYEKYLKELQDKENKFIVSTPLDFQNRITVSKLRQYIAKYQLDALFIDGITYLSDERGKRGDTKTISLTNISEDLMALSMEMKIPIIVVVQANRSGAVDKETDDTPELESIRDSDGISHNASKVISLKQNNDGALVMQIKKNRNSRVGDKLVYDFRPNIGEFIYISGGQQTSSETKKDDTPRQRKKKQETTTKEDVF